MIDFILNNIGTIIVSTIVLAILTAIVIYLVRKKIKKESTCGCGCSSCSYSDSCHSK